jgi:hypothetical protein
LVRSGCVRWEALVALTTPTGSSHSRLLIHLSFPRFASENNDSLGASVPLS